MHIVAYDNLSLYQSVLSGDESETDWHQDYIREHALIVSMDKAYSSVTPASHDSSIYCLKWHYCVKHTLY